MWKRMPRWDLLANFYVWGYLGLSVWGSGEAWACAAVSVLSLGFFTYDVIRKNNT